MKQDELIVRSKNVRHRLKVRGSEHPYDEIGFLASPTAEQIIAQNYKVKYPLSPHRYDHPRHLYATTGELVELELYRYQRARTENIEFCLCTMGHPVSTIERLVGFYPLIICNVEPAHFGSD